MPQPRASLMIAVGVMMLAQCGGHDGLFQFSEAVLIAVGSERVVPFVTVFSGYSIPPRWSNRRSVHRWLANRDYRRRAMMRPSQPLDADSLQCGGVEIRVLSNHSRHRLHSGDARIVRVLIGDRAVAHDVVDDDDRTGFGECECRLEVPRIVRLVRIDEHEIERLGASAGAAVDEGSGGFCGGPDVDLDPVAHPCAVEVRARHLGVVGFEFEGDNVTVVADGTGEPDRRVPGESAELKDPLRARDLGDEAEERTLVGATSALGIVVSAPDSRAATRASSSGVRCEMKYSSTSRQATVES